jgi:DNA-binding response OmpR family regulator
MEYPPLSGRSILIVEDEPLIALDIAQAFQEVGAEPVISHTLQEALVCVEIERLAAAVIDHTLHGQDSGPVCQRLNDRNLPFVVYSGLKKLHGACAAGVQVAKPENPRALVSIVGRMIESGAPLA